MSTKPRSLRKLLLYLLLGGVALFVLGDFVYSRIVAHRHRQWEASVPRDAEGVREGCNAFEIGEGSTAILLIHGINDSPHFYHKMAPRLATAGFACYAMRLPGFALPCAEYAQATKEDWTAAVAAKVNDLHRSHARVCIVAHSLGAAIAIQHVLEQPDGVAGVVLLAPGIAVANTRSPVLPVRAWHEVSRFTLLFTNLTESPFGIDAQDPAEASSPYRTPFTPRETIRQTFLLFDENRRLAGDLHTPMLMVLAAHDRVIDSRAARAFYDEAASSPKQLIEMPDAAHALAVDYGWEELTDHIVQFISHLE